MRRGLTLAVATLLSARAFAGGYEFPDNGTEALGRGTAFTAKADSPLAMQYNVAGLARQRGTRIELDMNLNFQKLEFTRLGSYPGTPDAAQPWIGQPYPKVANSGGMAFVPNVYISTDFHKLERWTFGFGLLTPSSIGNRNFGYTVKAPDGTAWPSPARYDIAGTDLTIAYPTLAAAVRATRWLSIGAAIHVVYGSFDLRSTSIIDPGSNSCPDERAGCDAQLQLKVSGVSATASLGFHFQVKKYLAFGINLRGPAYLTAKGKATSKSPPDLGGMVQEPAAATFKTNLPVVLRVGGRYIFNSDNFERGDIELNVVYEAWKMAQGDGPKIHIDNISFLSDINVQIAHNYRDTVSVRLGGAYNHLISPKAGVFTVRAGVYYDSAATKPQDTRINFDTLDKIGMTLGLGYRWKGLLINAAYAYVYSPQRTVTNGQLTPINSYGAQSVQGGIQDRPTGSDTRYPGVNNGTYNIATQVVSIGLSFYIEDFLKKKRVLTYDQPVVTADPAPSLAPTPAVQPAPAPQPAPEAAPAS